MLSKLYFSSFLSSVCSVDAQCILIIDQISDQSNFKRISSLHDEHRVYTESTLAQDCEHEKWWNWEYVFVVCTESILSLHSVFIKKAKRASVKSRNEIKRGDESTRDLFWIHVECTLSWYLIQIVTIKKKRCKVYWVREEWYVNILHILSVYWVSSNEEATANRDKLLAQTWHILSACWVYT